MGIKNLLPFVAQASRKGTITEFGGKTIAIDVSCLLHRSFTGCAWDVAQGKRSEIYINFIRKHVDIFLKEQCHVILVFDGQSLPAKKVINDQRSENRIRNRELGEISMANGDRTKAMKYFQMCTGITPDIVEHTIHEFRTITNVDIIVAPYEADAQLAYLLKCGIAHAIVTEDSDLIPFGCETIIFKLKVDATCVIYERKYLPKCVNRGLAKKFNFDLFRRLCIMSGCDYFPDGIPKVGLAKAVEVFAKSMFASDFCHIVKLLKRVPHCLGLKNVKVTDRMIRSFIEAEYTFLHQIVFDPITRNQIPLHDYSTNVPKEVEPYLKCKAEPYWFAGKALPAEDAFRRAIGNVDLKAGDKFKMDNPPVWSIYHPERLKGLKETSPTVQFIDSGYSSNNSQQASGDDINVVPATPENPFDDDTPVNEELEKLVNNSSSIGRSQKLSINVSSTPSAPRETFLNKSAAKNKNEVISTTPKQSVVDQVPADPSMEIDIVSEKDVQDENIDPTITTVPLADLSTNNPSLAKQKSIITNPSYTKQESITKKPAVPTRSFVFKTPTSFKRKVEVVTVSSRHGPSPQSNEIFKPRRSFNVGCTTPKPTATSNSFMSPRGIKRPLTEISGNESLNRSMENSINSSSHVRSSNAPQKITVTSTKSKQTRMSLGLSPRLFKNTFPSVEFPKKK